jgi:ribosomal protein L11 methyltransferase
MCMWIVKLKFKDEKFLYQAENVFSAAGFLQWEEFNWDEFQRMSSDYPEELVDKEKLLQEGRYYLKFYFSSPEKIKELREIVQQSSLKCDFAVSQLDDKVIADYLKIKQEIRIDDLLLITSDSLQEAALKNEKVKYIISLTPGAAFGTGEHETTYNCLKAMLELEEQPEKLESMLDIGTGSGILCILAKKMGFSKVKGFDIDPLSIETAEENARKNEVTGIEWELADIFSYQEKNKYDLVVANIYADILKENYSVIERLARKWLLLSGIHISKWEGVKEIFTSHFGVEKNYTQGEWQTVLLKREEGNGKI